MVQVVLEAEAAAEATALKGEAEAYAIEAKAKAEAEQMAKKADAWKEYKEAALVDMMLKVCIEESHYLTILLLLFSCSGAAQGRCRGCGANIRD